VIFRSPLAIRISNGNQRSRLKSEGIFLHCILIDNAFLILYIFIERFNNENAENLDGDHACFVGNIPVRAAG
jgi:hypothetical protein